MFRSIFSIGTCLRRLGTALDRRNAPSDKNVGHETSEIRCALV